jgi:hypothetical protein
VEHRNQLFDPQASRSQLQPMIFGCSAILALGEGTANGVLACICRFSEALFGSPNSIKEQAMIPGTAQRVTHSTSEAVNRAIQTDIRDSVRWYAEHPEEISTRLRELDAEWDIERTLEANASTLALTGVVLGATVDRRWLALPAAVTAFLLQHAVQGWCPPLPILRRMGFRTAREIDTERTALKVLRGDFVRIEGSRDKVTMILEAARA